MLPLSYVRDSCALKSKSQTSSRPNKMMIKDVLQKDNKNEQILSKLWVSKVLSGSIQEEKTWEFDGFSRTMHMTLTPPLRPRAVHDLLRSCGGFAKTKSCLWIISMGKTRRAVREPPLQFNGFNLFHSASTAIPSYLLNFYLKPWF